MTARLSAVRAQAATDELATAKAFSDALMGPIFKALGVTDARELAPRECTCGECGEKFTSQFQSKQCRRCRQAEYRAFDRETE